MKSFKQFSQIDEAGNISSSLAIKLQNDVIKFGRDVIRSKRIEDKLDNLAKQNGSLSGLVMLSVAVSGSDSMMSKLSRGLSQRKI